jgi:hypothetical protein
MVAEVFKALLEVLTLFRVRDGEVKQVDVPCERILVHGLNVAQLRHVEEEESYVPRHWSVTLTRRVNLRLRLLSNSLLLVDLVGELLGA